MLNSNVENGVACILLALLPEDDTNKTADCDDEMIIRNLECHDWKRTDRFRRKTKS